MLLAASGNLYAQKVIDKDQINERIRELRNRLKEYQTQLRSKPESADLQLEKISEELESREDVAVTVLFRDPELSQVGPSDNAAAALEEVRLDEEQNKGASPANGLKRLEELQKRQELFARLREKVKTATSGSKSRAESINSLIAQIR
jgi:YesN/AraC family two-component response regulator